MSDARTQLGPRPAGAPVGIALGTMNFGKRTPEAEARRILARAIERGVTWIDTADAYQDGASERIVGLVARDRADLVVATKVGLRLVKGKPQGLAPETIRRACDESLERLRRSAIDLYYLHAPDRAVPVDESLDAMHGLLRDGRVKAWGVSNYAAWEVLDLLHRADARGMPRPVVSQVLYNAAIRQLDVEYLPFATTHRLHTTVYNALAGGLLTGRLRLEDAPPPGSRFATQKRYRDRYWSERLFRFADGFAEIARRHALEPTTLAYAWLASRPIDSILLGPGTVAHLDAGIDGCRADVPPDALAEVATLQRAFDGTDAKYAR